ncbi:uncharacterized protein LOC127091063 [Lathyrus oleraceus]|uniref:uncharacterized protein LOC127091063 n=1 Tax=Pisum sativum TaxID=3888 RepID=UPI0021CED7EF|nr:uncharacterized protein LOC127091063 [Pisum sativum]
MNIEKGISAIDLNQPSQPEFHDEYNFEVEPTSVERRNISLSGLTIKSENIENGVRFSASLPSYLSSILDSDLGGTAKDELPSMILMRCTTCLMYLMVVKADSKCPKCKNQMMDAAKF